MGFSTRKSMKAGPLRVTASKSGVSVSAGVKGARVTRRADGRQQATLSVPGTGVRYTATARRAEASQALAGALPFEVISDGYSWSETPLRLKGFGFRRVTLHVDRVEIKRLFRRINIPAQDVVEVRAGAPTVLAHGFVWFATAADPGAVSKMGQGPDGVVHNEHVIMFNSWRPKHRRTYRSLVALLSQPPGA